MTVMLFRTVIIYVLLLAVLRLMGKRQIGELQPSELVTTILLSEIASQPVIDDNIPVSYGIVPVTAVLALEVIASFVVTKIPVLKKALIGKPSVLINRGKPDCRELSRVRVTMEELMSELRLQGVGNISDVYYAIMEENGKLSVILKSESAAATKKDVNINENERGIDRIIAEDGKINAENLKTLGKNEKWLKKQLDGYGAGLDEIFVMTCDEASNVSIVKKTAEGKSK